MSTWNDDRLEELSGRTDAGFKDVRAEMRDGFARVDQQLEKVDKEFKEVGQEFKLVRREMNEGFSRLDSELHRLSNTLISVGGVVVAAVLGTGILFGLS